MKVVVVVVHLYLSKEKKKGNKESFFNINLLLAVVVQD
jgi:hypothetical protein